MSKGRLEFLSIAEFEATPLYLPLHDYTLIILLWIKSNFNKYKHLIH